MIADALDQVLRATSAEDLFGPITPDPAAHRAAKRGYRKLATQLHPDRAPNNGIDVATATAAFSRLQRFYETWTTPNTPSTDSWTFRTRTGTYTVTERAATGTIASLYADKNAVIKIPRRVITSRFTENERTTLQELGSLTAEHPELAAFYPHLLDTTTHTDGDGTRRINILEKLEGFVTLAEVATAYPHGLDGRDWAWMHRRLLYALAGAHSAGLVHTAVTPDNVMIHPAQHALVLVGWSFATPTGRHIDGRVKTYLDDYPPEDRAYPETDIFTAHKLMARMLRPAETDQLQFARLCTQENHRKRPNAPALLAEYDALLEKLYGPRRFREFTLPATAGTT